MVQALNNKNIIRRLNLSSNFFTQKPNLITTVLSMVFPGFHQDEHKYFGLRTLKLFNFPGFPRPYYHFNLFKKLKYTNKNLRMWKEL